MVGTKRVGEAGVLKVQKRKRKTLRETGLLARRKLDGSEKTRKASNTQRYKTCPG